jgi:hypothetical protein
LQHFIIFQAFDGNDATNEEESGANSQMRCDATGQGQSAAAVLSGGGGDNGNVCVSYNFYYLLLLQHLSLSPVVLAQQHLPKGQLLISSSKARPPSILQHMSRSSFLFRLPWRRPPHRHHSRLWPTAARTATRPTNCSIRSNFPGTSPSGLFLFFVLVLTIIILIFFTLFFFYFFSLSFGEQKKKHHVIRLILQI